MFKKVRLYIMLAMLALTPLMVSCQKQEALEISAGAIPIQHNGRVKPMAGFALETVQLLTAKGTWQNKDAVYFILDILAKPTKVLAMPCIRVDYPALKELLGLKSQDKYFSYEQLKPSIAVIVSLMNSAQHKRDRDLRPGDVEQKAELLYQRIMTVDQLAAGEVFNVVPAPAGAAWSNPFEHQGAQADTFKAMVDLYAKGDVKQFVRAAHQWTEITYVAISEDLRSKLKVEDLYYQLKPFHLSWIFYFAGFLLLCLSQAWLQNIGKVSVLGGFLFHSVGIGLRVFILARPPVSNMYESMIFMDWILMACAGIFTFTQKKNFLLSTGALVSALIMIYAHLLPIDQSLGVLMPVLRSNYWLSIHVITIVSSYGMFAFAMALGHRYLWQDVTGKLTQESDKVSAHILYRLLQAGLITLGAGTVLGGVWANESWGRFWGWDPKETWSFITFLGYLAVLHLRYSEKLSNFALAVSSIVGFLLVLMTWYGVNFVLGRGLHSYGSGSGGIVWIVYFLIFEACFFLFVAIAKKKQKV